MMYLPERPGHPGRRFHVSIRLTATTAALMAVVAMSSLTPQLVGAQGGTWSGVSLVTESVCPDNAPAVLHSCAIEAAETFDPLRTPWGRPDLAGAWIHRAQGSFEDLEPHPSNADDSGGPGLVVDPPDGEVPMYAWAEARTQGHPGRYIHHNAACFLSGVPITMYHGSEFQFLQTPDHLVILGSNAHAYRIIPLDGRPHVGENIRLWNGDSSGYWEGNTLIIETTNQNGMPWFDQRGRFFTEDAHVVEHLTLIDPDTIHYQATVDDPNVFTHPFTIALAYRRITDEGYEMLPVACFEVNKSLMDVYRFLGFTVFPGISPREAREAMEAERN